MPFHASCHWYRQDLIHRQDSSTGFIDKCTSMGVGFGLKAHGVIKHWRDWCDEIEGASAMLHIMNMIASSWVSYRQASSTSAHRWRWAQGYPWAYSFADGQIKNKDRLEVWLGMWMFTLRACAYAISINNPSIRKMYPMLSNIYIPTNVLSPALCSNIITSTIWIMHLRKIRGKGRNACFAKKMHVSLGKIVCFDEKSK